MKIEYEVVQPDHGSSFKLIHNLSSAEDFEWQYHYHPEYEITCVLKGSGTRHIGNHFSRYHHGDLVMLGPNLPHSGFGLNGHGIHEEIVIQIKEEVLEQSMVARPEMAFIQPLLQNAKKGIIFGKNAREAITKPIKKLLKLSPFEKYIELLSVLHRMASTQDYELVSPTVDFSALINKNNTRLQKIFTYVENHYQQDIDIQKVASITNLSVPSFCNYFKKTMGMTFTDFINQYRIHLACSLLHQEKTVSEIGFDCGFNNIVYFNKVFKTITKKTPSEYKKEKINATYV